MERWTRFLEKLTEWSLYGLIICIPLTKAGIEICSATAIFSWLISRGLLIYGNQRPPMKRGFSEQAALFGVQLTGVTSFIDICLGIFILANLVAVFLSQYFGLSLHAFFSKLLEGVVLFFLIKNVVCDERILRRALRAGLLVLVVIAADCVFQWVTGFDFVRHRALLHSTSISASYTNPNDFAGWLLVSLPFLLGAYFGKPMNRLRDHVLFVVLAVTLMTSLGLTDSRGAWFGFVFGVFCILYVFLFSRMPKAGKQVLSVVPILALITIGWILYVSLRGDTPVAEWIDLALSGRIKLWRGVIRMIESAPIFGSGLNTFMRIYPSFTKEHYQLYAHNSFLQMTAEIGLVGVSAFLLFFLALLRQAAVLIQKRFDATMLIFVFAVAGFLGHSFWDTNLYALPLVMAFWVMTGLAAARMAMISKGFQDA